jgi:hypothetical protein
MIAAAAMAMDLSLVITEHPKFVEAGWGVIGLL